ncbi:MAG TPA: glycosyltransferase family 9 protein [Candidatus Polarisedimenticolia bacterium]|nr:glycosyltransferase family 9 protein [Candidatus Polarisedimenticolia bacterium]
MRLGAVGDVIRALPAVHRLRLAYPRAHVSWVVEDLAAPLLQGHADLDDVVVLSRRELREAGRRPARLLAMATALRTRFAREGSDVTIDLQSTFKSGIVALLTGARRRVGFAPTHAREGSSLFANEWARPSSPHLNRVDRNLEMAALLGAPDGPVTAAFREREDEAKQASRILADLGPARGAPIVLCPGASRRQAYKRWPVSAWSRLAILLADANRTPVVVWGPGEEDLAARIAQESDGRARPAPPTSLPVLAALLRRSALFIGADTGPMHLAWAVGCRVVALFGPTDPRLNAPVGPGHQVLVAPDRALARLAPETVCAAALRGLAPDAR